MMDRQAILQRVVRFLPGRTRLGPGAEAELDTIVAAFHGLPFDVLNVVGRVAPHEVRGREAGERLARQREVVVQEALVARGIPGKRIALAVEPAHNAPEATSGVYVHAHSDCN